MDNEGQDQGRSVHPKKDSGSAPNQALGKASQENNSKIDECAKIQGIKRRIADLRNSSVESLLVYCDTATRSPDMDFPFGYLSRVFVDLVGEGHGLKLMEWFVGHPELYYNADMRGFVTAFAKREPERAIEYSLQMGCAGETMLQAGFYQLGIGDIVSGRAKAAALSGVSRRLALIAVAVAAKDEGKYKLALEIVRDAGGPPEGGKDVVAEVFKAWLESDRVGAMAAANDITGTEATQLLGSPYFRNWIAGNLSAEEAFDIVRSVPLTGANVAAYSDLCQNIARKSPDAVLRELGRLPQGAFRSDLYSSVFAVLAESDPDGTSARLAALDGTERSHAVAGIVRHYAPLDFEKATRIADGEQGPSKVNAYRQIALVAARLNPENAVRMIESTNVSICLGSDFRQEMIDHTVRFWANQDLATAQQWVEKLPEADAAKGYQGLMTSWMKTDPVAASEWLSKQALGPARDAGAKVLIEQIKDTDPERAEQWRKSLTSPAGK